MAFKMKGFPKHKGTKGLTYIPQSMRDKGFQDDGSYDSDFEYDRLGRPIVDTEKALNISKNISDEVGATGKYGADSSDNQNIFGDITRSSITGSDYKDYFDSETFTERGRGHEKEFELAVKRYKEAEKKHGVGNVKRGNMDDRSFDYLLHFGGPEETGGSWIQQRLIDSAYGRVDNEPHVAGTDSMMYEEGEFTKDKAPNLRKIQKNFRNSYLNVMNDPLNRDFQGQTNQSGVVSKKDAMNIAKTLLPTESLTRYPDPIRDNQLNPPGSMTLEEEEIEAKKIDEQTEKDVEELDRTQPIVEEKPKDENVDIPKEPSIMGFEGGGDKKLVEEKPVEKPPVEEEVVASGKRENPYEYGTDEYYDFKKQERSRKLGLTKRIFNIYDNK